MKKQNGINKESSVGGRQGDAVWGWFVPEDAESHPEWLPECPIVLPVQTHTVNVGVAENAGQSFPDTDALITKNPSLAVGVRTADCVPVVLYAPDIRAVAAIHAGWKGTVGGICAAAVKKLADMGADPSALIAAVGPCVCGDCYEVGDDLADKFVEAGLGEYVFEVKGPDPLTGENRSGNHRRHINLAAANKAILTDAGLNPNNITNSEVCTRHSPPLPSWRRTPGESRRIITYIRLMP